MDPTAEYRDALKNLLDSVQRHMASEHMAEWPEEPDEDWANEIELTIHNHIVISCLFNKTPIDPPQLSEIAKVLRELPLVTQIIQGWPGTEIDHSTTREDLTIMEFKLREMLQYLPQATSPTTTPIARATNRQRGSRRVRRTRLKRNLKPSQRRAADVAKIIKELNVIRPDMTGTDSDYETLASKHKRFLTFRIARQHPHLKEKVLNLQGHRRHIRLAQELTATKHGRELSTVQVDWKKHKPAKYRQRNK